VTVVASFTIGTLFVVRDGVTEVGCIVVLVFVVLFTRDDQLASAFGTVVPVDTFAVVMVQFVLTLFSLEGRGREDVVSVNHVEFLVLNHGVETQLVVE
jgi:hypothetical protein